MGKTKTKIMDDTPVEAEKKPALIKSGPAKKLGRQDELVEKLKAELAAEEPKEKQATSLKSAKISPVMTSDAKQSSTSNKEIATGRRIDLRKTKPRSRKYQEASKDLDKSKTYPLAEAVELTKKASYSKTIGTLEIHINTIQTGIRGLVSLPFVSGKRLKILAFGKGAETSGADVAGTEETIEEINKGKVNFDLIITTPEWMPKLAKVARILGPRGLMPNPKNGTITSPSADGLKKTVEGFQAGKTEFKTESKAAVIHLGLGKLNQPTEELSANIKTLLQTLGKTKVKKVSLSPTMGPSVKLDLSSF